MKNVIFLVVGLALGFVAGVFTGRCGAGASNATAPASAATVKADAVDDVFSGEAKDGELVEVGEYGKFRLNPKQKEIVEKKKIRDEYFKIRAGFGVNERAQIAKDNPWILEDKGQVAANYRKLVVSLLKSRKQAEANN